MHGVKMTNNTLPNPYANYGDVLLALENICCKR